MERQIQDLVDSVKECLAIVIDESSDIAETFQAGDTGKGNQKVLGYLENISCLLSAIDALHRGNSQAVANVKTDTLQNLLVEMEQAMLTRDYVLLADILQYEIKEVLGEMQGAL